MIVLQSKAGTNDIEEFLRSVQDNPGQPLKLPIDTSFGGAFGFSPLLTLGIARWARLNNGDRELHLSEAFANNPDTANRFASTLHGMAALYFATRVHSGQSRLTRFEALGRAKPFVEAMERADYGSTTRGTSVLLTCFEGADREVL